jgi:hypothetical protein
MVPSRQDGRGSPSRQDAFRFLPSGEFTLEFPSKGELPPVSQLGAVEKGGEISIHTNSGIDEGEDSSTLVLQKHSRAGSNSSLASTPMSLDRKDEQPAYDAKQILDKIKEVENMANAWAKTQGDDKSAERVKELVTLREALCDDFAADLDLYIAFYCVSKELQEGQRSVMQA